MLEAMITDHFIKTAFVNFSPVCQMTLLTLTSDLSNLNTNQNFEFESKKYINTKQSNKKNNQISKDKRQDYNMK